MSRLWLGIGILLLVLALGIGVTLGLTAAQEPVAEELRRAEALARSGDVSAAAVQAEQARHRWEQCWHFNAAVTDHEPMEEIDALFAELPARQDTPQEYAALCARLARLTQNIADAHKLSWWNFL